ncbi:trehalose-phosphatase [Microbaculum marinum]|uniref:Trehalose 6-phosphate phosphatase n=1 Tax=Microbaculum marinum TaxID=1764581 RepID=A0AAW9RRG2_9HYPH
MTPAAFPDPRNDWALFLDFDGTLVEIAASPDAVRAEQHLVGTLRAISDRLGGALAIVSGRPISEIDAHLDHAGLAAAGLHGLEVRRRPWTAVTRVEGARPERDVGNALRELAAANPGLLFEDKGPAVALHYRNRPELEATCREAVRAAVGRREHLHILEGKMVFEVKSAASDKGRAVQLFMSDAPFRGRTPVFAGDDVTDEDGFAAARALGGFGIKIGEGETTARWRIGSVSDFLRWLGTLPDRLDGARPAEEVVDR